MGWRSLKKEPATTAVAALVAVLVAGLAGCPAAPQPAPKPPKPKPPPPAPTLEGTWEGELPIPASPVRLEITLVKGASRVGGPPWSGTLSGPGAESVSLTALTIASTKISFRVHVGEDIDFAGELVGDQLKLSVDLGQAMPLAMWRVPAAAPAAERDEAWRRDIAAVRDRFLRFDKSFSPDAKTAAQASLAALSDRVATLDDAHIIVALLRTVATAGNARTHIALAGHPSMRQVPLRLWWFGDDLRVIRARLSHKDVFGCSVVAIAGQPVASVVRSLAPLIAGNASRRRDVGSTLITRPAVLAGLDLTKSATSIEFRFRCRGTEQSKVVAIDETPSSRTDSWRDLLASSDAQWVASDQALLPGYLRRAEESAYVERIAESTLVVHYRGAVSDEGAPFSVFADAVRSGLSDAAIDKVIVDLRLHTGRRHPRAQALFDEIAAHDKITQGASLVVLSSRMTFGDGIRHAAQLAASGKARVIGESVGDELDSWGEGGKLVLPHSKLVLQFTAGFHAYSVTPYPDREPIHSDLNVTTLEPMIRIEPTWTDHARGRDPVLRAALDL